MISVKEALKIALSEELNESEQKVFNIITKHIDKKIKSNFNGNLVSIQIEGYCMDGSTSSSFHLSNFVSESWRRDIINKKWRKEYESGGWKIEDIETKDSYGRKRIHHNFTIEFRRTTQGELMFQGEVCDYMVDQGHRFIIQFYLSGAIAQIRQEKLNQLIN